MSLIPYGNTIPANISIEDIDLQFTYQHDLNVEPESIQVLNAQDFIKKTFDPNNVNENNAGVYRLSIPASFYANRGLGYYYFYLRPKKIRVIIKDCAYLEDVNLKGLIFDLNEMDSYAKNIFQKENNLVGYLIQYINQTNTGDRLAPNLFRIVTSNYRANPISGSINNNQNQNGIRYRLNSNSSLVFVTVSPSTQSGISNNETLFIGNPAQEVIVSNTNFNPKLIPIQITDVDEKSLLYGIFGDQTFNYENGIRTWFDEEGNIFKQKDEYTIKDEYGNPLKKISKERTEINFNEEIN